MVPTKPRSNATRHKLLLEALLMPLAEEKVESGDSDGCSVGHSSGIFLEAAVLKSYIELCQGLIFFKALSTA